MHGCKQCYMGSQTQSCAHARTLATTNTYVARKLEGTHTLICNSTHAHLHALMLERTNDCMRAHLHAGTFASIHVSTHYD